MQVMHAACDATTFRRKGGEICLQFSKFAIWRGGEHMSAVQQVCDLLLFLLVIRVLRERCNGKHFLHGWLLATERERLHISLTAALGGGSSSQLM